MVDYGCDIGEENCSTAKDRLSSGTTPSCVSICLRYSARKKTWLMCPHLTLTAAGEEEPAAQAEEVPALLGQILAEVQKIGAYQRRE